MTDPMTYLDEVDARVEAATEGPWMSVGLEIVSHPDGEVVCDTVTDYPSDRRVFNSAFIARARTDLPALSKALRAVLELHHHVQLPISGSSLGDVTYSVGCAHCTRSAEVATYPCPTVQTIQAALVVNDEGRK